MTEPSAPVPDPTPAKAAAGGKPLAAAFRWQAFFGRTADPVFVLDRRRRLLFVNAAWENLTGIPAGDAHRLVCRRPRPAGPGDPPHAVVEHALTPPPEVRQGATMRVRRPPPGPAPAGRWWDVDFLPLRTTGEKAAVFILGRITPSAAEEAVPAAPLPERLVALRERRTQRFGPELLSDTSPALRRLAEQVRLAGRTTVPVLLVGEPGVGKRTLARLIHYQGRRREQPFVVLECERLPSAALADVLFGGGPALGAIYLHEPSRLPRDLQLRLCELVHAATDADPGASAPRILAGCGVDPAEEVRAGRLLDELNSALAILTLYVPPLRERRADLPALVDRLLQRGNAEGGPPIHGLSADAWEAVREYAWPGNLRELYAVLSSARRCARTDRIGAADLPAAFKLLRRMEETPGRRPERPLPLDALLEEAERRLIDMALRRARGKKYRAAEILEIWRTRLIRRMKALGVGDAEADDAGGEGGTDASASDGGA